jgi:glucan phosphoethanolaminetransferase (alkaline phosphatase superfamily)
MTASLVLWLLFWLFVKHFIVDFPLQRKFQYSNKGVYGHPGGLLHAGGHGVATFLVLILFPTVTLPMAIILSVLDFVAHYHIDWAKVNINQKMGWGPMTHEEYWWLLGLDQCLHALTYFFIAMMVI